jgi:endo-1,4-beta-xylanase
MRRALTLLLSVAVVGALHAGERTLKQAAPAGLLIGAALNERQAAGGDPLGAGIVSTQFTTISPENAMKFGPIHPEAGRYAFEAADQYVAFGQAHRLAVIGHCLVWHQQTPRWVFEGQPGERADRDTLLGRMRAHVETVVGRYKGRVHGWDVVNEALEEDGTLRRTPWLLGIGPDYIAKAFEFAHAADPAAELYYNDYNLWKPAKRAAAIRLVKELRARGLRVDAIGEQAHWGVDEPTLAEIDATIKELGEDTGVKVLLTELDIDVLPRDPDMWGADLSRQSKIRAATNLYPNGLPDEQQRQLARRYGDIFTLVSKYARQVGRVTFWGVTDANSWLHNFPIPGRVNYPLLWDRDGKPKPAFDAVVDALERRGGAASNAKSGAAFKLALTFDDLPVHSTAPPSVSRVEIARSVLSALEARHAPPTYGFVNAKALDGNPDHAKVLEAWRAAGHPLGNHTFSHMDLDGNTIEAFQQDVVANEATLRHYMGDEGWKWLRFPYLHEGETPEKRAAVGTFLKDRGYRPAHVTITFGDWAYNEPFARCLARGDLASVEWMKDSFLRHARASIAEARSEAVAAYDRDIPHVMLLHLGGFDAVMMPQLLDLIETQGGRLVPLGEALDDSAYSANVGPTGGGSGGTWLDRLMAARLVTRPAAQPDDTMKRLSALCK